MSLTLGKQLDRCYSLRLPFLDAYYNISIFFHKKSTQVLYNIDPDFSNSQITDSNSVRVNMFKNLSGSKFCECFLDLHNFKKSTLDIINQFHGIKPKFSADISFILNESLNLSKVDLDDRTLFDTLTIYGFTLVPYTGEYIFLISERQNINKQLGKKLVRTTGLQIGTNRSLEFVNDLYYKYEQDFSNNQNIINDDIIDFNEAEQEDISKNKEE